MVTAESEVVFRAMADATRQRALMVLRRHELNVSELVDVLDQPQSTISRHLKTLRDAGLIVDRRDGTAIHYSLSRPDEVENDRGNGLRSWCLRWAGDQPIPEGLAARLRRTLEVRRAMSERFFSGVADHWDTLRERSFGSTFHLEALLSLLPSGWTVADIGCGTGFLLSILARHFKRVLAIDPVDQMLDVARRRVDAARLTNVDLRKGDLAGIPIADDYVDLGVALLVLHHVPAPNDAIAELMRIIRPGGRLLIVEQRAHRYAEFRERMQDRWWGFEPEDMSGRLASAGFGDVRWRSLATADSVADADVPELFVITARKPTDSSKRDNIAMDLSTTNGDDS
ncbi:MAG: metalloregulator ArsR/SmtB family transcription factor [Planctomycetes bacterium]|nr:metalloregulator ArsR/SmtB family transcription factor [Planctomycetota bacterium]